MLLESDVSDAFTNNRMRITQLSTALLQSIHGVKTTLQCKFEITNVFFPRVPLRTDLPEFPQELSIAEEYHSKGQNEAGGEESDDVAVVCDIG